MNRFCYLLFIVALSVVMPIRLQAQYQIAIKNASSLVRVGMNPHPTDSTDISIAYTLMSAIDHENLDSMIIVRDYYQQKAKDDVLKEKAWGALAYIVNRMIAERGNGEVEKGDLLTEDLYEYFTANACENLRDYLVLKYELNNYHPRSVKEYIDKRNFYDDMLMFNSPDREDWDMTSKIMKLMPVKEGDKLVDVGCGFGYNSYRFLELVGTTGKVYATDTEKTYTDYFGNLMKQNDITNIEVINSTSSHLGVNDQVDCIFMSSLYHVFYTWSREDERNPYLSSIKDHLKPDGKIVIVDNINLHGNELNNCHVSPELIQAQLGYWGFEPTMYKELNDKRFMLVLKRNDSYTPHKRERTRKGVPILTIDNQKSVVHIGSLDSYDITDRGIDAASYVYDFIHNGDKNLADIAIKKYTELIPSENFGGEYSALQWLCEAMTADEAQREEMLQDPLTRSFYHKMTDDSCKVLSYYLLHKYKLGNDSLRMLSDSILEKTGEVGRTHRSYLEDYILALNPRRPNWEHTSDIVDNLGIKYGETIADIGCGSGFFTYRFSNMVGSEGKVYAIELKDEHLQTLQNFLDKEHITNVETMKGREDIIELPEKVDKMFMCSLYHVLYGVIPDNDRDTYLKSLCKYLKPGGELIIIDNGPVDDDMLPYHGPYIARELIEYQLSYYGFELTDYKQIIPQRYMLKFRLKE